MRLKRDRARCATETSKQRSEKAKEDRTIGTLFKLLVKQKLLYGGKVLVNTKLRFLRREKRGTEVQQYRQHFEQGDKDVMK